MDKDITTLLHEIKAHLNWTETRLSEEIGTSQPTVNRILSGQGECKIATYQAIHALHTRTFAQRERKTRRTK